MGRWASKKVREQREKLILQKHEGGYTTQQIANHLGIKPGSVLAVLKKHSLAYRRCR